MEETKKLTDAQKAHLLKLMTRRDAAQADLDSFISYLTAEHDIDAKDGWTLNINSGFARPAQEPSDGDH
jgi:plasmid stabilization system protein ParE